jgi:hypothetical protein
LFFEVFCNWILKKKIAQLWLDCLTDLLSGILRLVPLKYSLYVGMELSLTSPLVVESGSSMTPTTSPRVMASEMETRKIVDGFHAVQAGINNKNG